MILLKGYPGSTNKYLKEETGSEDVVESSHAVVMLWLPTREHNNVRLFFVFSPITRYLVVGAPLIILTRFVSI